MSEAELLKLEAPLVVAHVVEEPLPQEKYNPQNWLIVELGTPCQLDGCKYLNEHGTSKRMHRHCLQLSTSGARCTYNTERTSNLPGHDRVHLKGDPEKDDDGNIIQNTEVVRVRRAPKKRAARELGKVLSDESQTLFTEVGATMDQMGELQRKGIQFLEDCRLYHPKEIKDCLLGMPPDEKRETEARQLLVKIDFSLRRSGCSIGDLDLGFSDS